ACHAPVARRASTRATSAGARRGDALVMGCVAAIVRRRRVAATHDPTALRPPPAPMKPARLTCLVRGMHVVRQCLWRARAVPNGAMAGRRERRHLMEER